MSLFIVHGTTGEYDDYHDWAVAAFSREGRAKTWARRANEWAAAHGLAGRGAHGFRSDLPDNPYDAKMSVDYTGVQYFIVCGIPLDPPLPR